MLWVKYGQGKLRMVFPIGEVGGNVVGLDASAISQEDTDTIRRNVSELEKMTFSARVLWLKKNVNYNSIIKTYKKSKMEIMSSFDIDAMQED